MYTINIKSLRRSIDNAIVAGDQERDKNNAERLKRRNEQFEKEKPVHLARAKKILKQLPALIKEEKARRIGDGVIYLMEVPKDDYDHDRISSDLRRRRNGYNYGEPYLTMRHCLKPHSTSALVIDTCEQLGLNPRLEFTSCSWNSGATIYCDCP